MPRFNVTYARVNESEATAGGTTRHGFLATDLTLRGAIQAAHRDMPPRSDSRGGYASDSTLKQARCYSVESEEWGTGDSVTYSIHFPDNTTPASRARLCRVLAKYL